MVVGGKEGSAVVWQIAGLKKAKKAPKKRPDHTYISSLEVPPICLCNSSKCGQ